MELVRCGYTQEFYVLLRTIDEYKTHIDFILYAREPDGRLTEEAEKYIRDYFSDYARRTYT